MIDHQSSRGDEERGAGVQQPGDAQLLGDAQPPGGGARGSAAEAAGGNRPVTLEPAQSTARMADGTLLRTLRWQPNGEPWAVALIVHGLGEHAGRYATVAAALTRDGIDVHAYDHRGFGESAGQRADVDRWGQFHDDLEARVSALRSQGPELPLIMWGHSMGGLIACGYVLSPSPRPLPDLLVLSSPGLDIEVAAWKRSLVAALARVLPGLRLSNGPLEDGLSHDPAIREAYANDTLRVGSSTTRFANEAFREQARVRAAIAGLDAMPVPTYVFHGSADPIVPVAASAPLGTKGRVTRHVHEGLRHETHHEYEHAAVLGEVVAWLEGRRPDLGADADATGPAATDAMSAASSAGVAAAEV